MNRRADEAVEWLRAIGRVEHRHAVLGAGIQVDLVVARTGAADHNQVRRTLCKRASFDPRTKDYQSVNSLEVDPA